MYNAQKKGIKLNSLIINIVTVIIIFSTHIVFISHHLITPFLWSTLFIYLYEKKHLYLAINAYLIVLLMLIAHRLNFGIPSSAIELSYSSIAIFATFSFIFMYQEMGGKRFKIATTFSFLIAIVLYSIPLAYIIYYLNFNVKITKNVFFAISQTNFNESVEYINQFISPLLLLSVLAFTITLGYFLIKQEQRESVTIERSLLVFVIIFSLGTAKVMRSNNTLLAFAKNAARDYKKEIDLFKQAQKKMKNGDIKFEAKKTGVGETYIVVIGESLNKHHMGIYGYKRKTTPLLSKHLQEENFLLFTNIYSNHTHTMPVLSLSLTEANQYNKKGYYESLSIVDVLKKADVETYWLTNQNLYGAWDNMVSIVAHSADHLIGINQSIGTTTEFQKYDGDLINEVKKVLNKPTKKNRVIFVHLMGNHGAYDSRYPDGFSIYNDELKNKSINPYDNSVVYNDYVVNSILNELQNIQGVRGFIYMSDHADDVDNELGHNSAKFTFDMTQIPFITWFSDEYINRYPSVFTTFKSHKKTLFSNDLFYDTLIGMFNVETDHYNKKYDLTNKNFSLNPNDALTLHGKIHYTDKNNHFYWKTQN
jgi:glucan phosphoethanolaminetransferase (alkaline phosphatase superfamily)